MKGRRGNKPGERNSRAKLTDAKVLEARRLRAEGESFGKLARRYEVGTETIRLACTGQTWRHLQNA